MLSDITITPPYNMINVSQKYKFIKNRLSDFDELLKGK